MRWRLSVGLAMAVCLGLSGCAEKRTGSTLADVQPPAKPSPSACPGIFVLAPAAYMQYIHEDEPVLLASEGRRTDLAVYCTAQEAVSTERTLEEDCLLAPGLWRLYRLQGVWEQDVVEIAPGNWRMRRPSELIPHPQG
ncbi:MAG: DVU_2496 family lipoprotein [Bilophila sp.]